MMEIETVAVIGASREAVRVALLCSLARMDVRLCDEDPGALDRAFQALRHDVEQALASGQIDRDERQRILYGILFTPDPGEAVTGADLVFAAGSSDAAAVCASLRRIAGSCRATALLASRVEPSAVAGEVPQPGRVVALVLEEGDRPLPRLAFRTGPSTTAHARARGEQ